MGCGKLDLGKRRQEKIDAEDQRVNEDVPRSEYPNIWDIKNPSHKELFFNGTYQITNLSDKEPIR